jgi:hypothetical protein
VRDSSKRDDRLRKRRINERLSHARVATLVCSCGLSRTGVRRYILRLKRGRLEEGQLMAHLVDKEFVERANTVLLLGILWTGLAVCVIGALAYDIAYWLQNW